MLLWMAITLVAREARSALPGCRLLVFLPDATRAPRLAEICQL
jgi:hypothetical protein